MAVYSLLLCLLLSQRTHSRTLEQDQERLQEEEAEQRVKTLMGSLGNNVGFKGFKQICQRDFKIASKSCPPLPPPPPLRLCCITDCVHCWCVSRLGQGSFAHVYRVVHTRTKIEIA